MNRWDSVPVWAVYHQMPGETPVPGKLTFSISQRITRTDGRVIYAEGARRQVTIGNPEDQDAEVRATVRAAWLALDSVAPDFDELEWSKWWDTKILPAAVFTSFPAQDDPDIVQHDWRVKVSEGIPGGKEYPIETLLRHLENPIPGVNLGVVEVPPGAPNAPLPVYAKGIAGGVAALDRDGDVVDSRGQKVVGGGGGGGDVATVNGKKGTVVLGAADVGALPATATLDSIPEGTSSVKVSPAEKQKLTGVESGATKNAADTALRDRSSHTGTQPVSSVEGLSTALGGKVDTTRKIAGKPLSADVTLAKTDVGLSNVDNTADADKPLSTAAATALGSKVDAARKVAGKPLTADVTLVKADVGLAKVDNTTDLEKPVSAAQANAIAALTRPTVIFWDEVTRTWGSRPPWAAPGSTWISAHDPTAPPPPVAEVMKGDMWLRSDPVVP